MPYAIQSVISIQTAVSFKSLLKLCTLTCQTTNFNSVNTPPLFFWSGTFPDLYSPLVACLNYPAVCLTPWPLQGDHYTLSEENYPQCVLHHPCWKDSINLAGEDPSFCPQNISKPKKPVHPTLVYRGGIDSCGIHSFHKVCTDQKTCPPPKDISAKTLITFDPADLKLSYLPHKGVPPALPSLPKSFRGRQLYIHDHFLELEWSPFAWLSKMPQSCSGSIQRLSWGHSCPSTAPPAHAPIHLTFHPPTHPLKSPPGVSSQYLDFIQINV